MVQKEGGVIKNVQKSVHMVYGRPYAPHLYILPTVEKTVQTQISVFNDCEMKRHKK